MKFEGMINMKKLGFVLLFMGLQNLLNAQINTTVKFKKLLHEFGNIKEESENAIAVFSFKNISNKPIWISKVETSCGCTTPEYIKDTIQPGDTGYVKAIYGTRGRGGEFHKNVFVYFNNNTDLFQSLMITGYVIPEANLANRPSDYSTTYSNLAFTTTMAELNTLLNTEKRVFKYKAFNYMGYPIRIYEVETPEYIDVNIGDSVIDVNDSITITITVDASKLGPYGEIRRRIGLITDDPNGSTKILHIHANLKEDFSKMSKKDLKNAPIIKMDPKGVIDLGKHSAGEKFSYTINITNNGKSPLKLHSILPNCSCISYKIGKQVLEAGESIQLVLTIDTVNQSIASHTKYIIMYTNDPNNPEIRIKIVIDITT